MVTVDGNISIDVDSLDNVMSDVSEPISAIKLDIEGSELEALKGAMYTIKKYKPLISVCVYHKNDDLFTIPLFLKNNFKDVRVAWDIKCFDTGRTFYLKLYYEHDCIFDDFITDKNYERKINKIHVMRRRKSL